ncbi:MAG TPA: DUF305 domain-containing protein [Herpetosiphonaceae bacterium]|nr:DUF305 domain-containing protein [Herpetosiphonaceae bacterium]
MALALILTALVLATLAPKLLPAAYGTGGADAQLSSGMLQPGGGAGDQPFDLVFLDKLSMQHTGTVRIALLLSTSLRPELRDLAHRIITSRLPEIDQLWQWRLAWYEGAGVEQTQIAAMAQLLGDDQPPRDSLTQAMGTQADVDRLLLMMLIPQHETTIALAGQALRQAQHTEIKTLAQAILTSHSAEIEEMRGYLADAPAEALAPSTVATPAVTTTPDPSPTLSEPMVTPTSTPPPPTATPPAPPTVTSTSKPPDATVVQIVEPPPEEALPAQFSPNVLQVKAGTTVTWINTGATPHTVTAEDGTLFDSGRLEPGWQFTFTPAAGTIDYLCTLHPWMKGTLVVQP